MRSPVQGRPLILYTASSDVAIGALLAQEDEEGVEHPIYYYSRTMKDAQLRYPKAERTCLMSEFDIVCVSPKAIKGQAVADLLASFQGEDSTTLQDNVPGEFPEISVVKEETSLLYFDGSATPSNDTGGAGIVLVSPSGEVFSHSFKMDFHCTNNSAEYEAFLLGLSLAKQAGAMHLEIIGDSKLLVNQMNRIYSLKEITLAPFRDEAQRLLTHFADATITHTGQTDNRHVDCLATLASKLQFEGS
ncbi:uncharacterized protein LOC113295848 [Papaver somniferum]|uniref:uncharacterized protein LOC113295848 n=1 Tax=Papaver somniferum TaxID=3469 RepID=UPI000E6FA14A|nr:uncharacterized protein LOC113295848 [Papaver somniferum]